MVIKINDYIECVEKKKKVRLVSIKDGKILVVKYGGYYMLPGGKIDEDETPENALKREIFEETGNNITKIEEYLTTIIYAKDYQSRSKPKKLNRKIETQYYYTDEIIDLTKQKKLSQNEINGNFNIEYIEIDELVSLISKENQTPKERIFSKELLTVINYYLKKEQLIDMHTHTCYSDGQYTPDEVINQAINNNIKTISITDHDTILGLKQIDFNKYSEIEIIPGIELTVKRPHGRMHILGFQIDYENKQLLNTLKSIKDNNINNLQNIVKYLKENGIEFIEEDLDEIFTRIGNIGRPDIAKLLIKYGIVKTVQEAFDKYLIKAFNETRSKTKGYTYQEIIKLILDANGIPILAHPNSLELDNEEFEELLKDMIKSGLMGLEVYHSNISEEERIYYMSLVNKYNLLYSAGSDYHGEKVKPQISLGTGNSNLYITETSVLKYIHKKTR